MMMPGWRPQLRREAEELRMVMSQARSGLLGEGGDALSQACVAYLDNATKLREDMDLREGPCLPGALPHSCSNAPRRLILLARLRDPNDLGAAAARSSEYRPGVCPTMRVKASMNELGLAHPQATEV